MEFDVDEAVTQALVPSLVLQPLVENSLKYAVAPREEGGRLRVEAREQEGKLLLVVQDDGPGLPVGVELGAGRGVGFRNTRERLAVLYGDQQKLAVRFSRPGLRLEITMPFERCDPTDMTIRTIIVDDEPLARRGLELRLQDASDISIVRQCANGREAIASIAERRPRPDVPRHPDARRLRARSRRAGAAGKHADGGLRHGVRSLRDQRLRGTRARLPAEARRR